MKWFAKGRHLPRLWSRVVVVCLLGISTWLGVAYLSQNTAVLINASWFGGLLALLILTVIAMSVYRWHQRRIQTLSQKLVGDIAGRTTKLSSLYTITAVVSSTLDLQETLTAALNSTLELMACPAGGIHLFQGGVAKLALINGCCLSQNTINRLEQLSLTSDFLKRAVQSGKPLILTDLSNLKTIPFHADGFDWLVVTPLTSRGTVLGTLFMVRQAAESYSPPDSELLASIGNQIGVAIENACLYEQARQLAIVEERNRLARDLHDSVTQSIYSLTLLAEAGRRMIQAGDMALIQQNQERLSVIAQQALQEMRLLVYQLRPLDLRQTGLVAAIEHRLEVVERRAGIDVKMTVSGELCLPEAVEEALYRISQEALNNSLKHAQATAVSVTIQATPATIMLEVKDNGRGFETALTEGSGGLGLITMRERAEKLHGHFTITSTPANGTTVRAEIPATLDQETAVTMSTPQAPERTTLALNTVK